MKMSLNDYKLSCELIGHSSDVRSVAAGEKYLVSGSRDKTAKVWESDGNGYRESLTLINHKNFISSVCLLDDGEWICTGSNDSTIAVYIMGNVEPFAVLRDHTSTVCALAQGLEKGTLISGSWDKTARIFQISGFGQTTSVCLRGHEAAVWAVTTLMKSGQYVTGSADKTISFWNAKGEQLKVLKGHTDCVRGLIGLPDNGLLSCANDAVIKHWNADGECIKELHGHSNYIYSMALNPALGENVLVSGGEDSTIRMWDISNGQLGDEIRLPVESVWSVACLKNGDIMTGTSDGIVRIFTRDSSRFGSEQVLEQYKVAVDNRVAAANQTLGGYNVNELPGPEVLLKPGTEGQTKIVREPNGKLMCHQWTNGEWLLVGDVTGASGGSQETSGKVLFEGKEYDYVFNVDISDTEPAIKLPYNRDEDPWHAAQKFVHKQQLPQVYLEQVANFIIKNSAQSGQAKSSETASSGYQDPFTGGSRYVPGSSNSHLGNGNGLVDPFTGSSSYQTQQQTATKRQKQMKHFPYIEHTSFDSCELGKVLNKLKEFNDSVQDVELQVSNEELNKLELLANLKGAPDIEAIETLQKIIDWPEGKRFPVLDIARMAVRNEATSKALMTDKFTATVLSNLTNSIVANQMMAVRLLSNMLSHKSGELAIFGVFVELMSALLDITKGSNNLQIAIATLYLNLSAKKTNSKREVKHMTEGILATLEWITDAESCYRLYQALGNILTASFQMSGDLIGNDKTILSKIQNHADGSGGLTKLNEIAKELISIL